MNASPSEGDTPVSSGPPNQLHFPVLEMVIWNFLFVAVPHESFDLFHCFMNAKFLAVNINDGVGAFGNMLLNFWRRMADDEDRSCINFYRIMPARPMQHDVAHRHYQNYEVHCRA